MGCEVVDIGQCGTEMIYFATAHLGLDGGIMITASHNPKEYNGLKLVRKEARPISGDTGLKDIEAKVMAGELGTPAEVPAKVIEVDIMKDYIDHLLTYVDMSALKPLKIVVNSGNGAAGPAIDELEKRLPFNFIKVNNNPDGTFPNGVPNPLLNGDMIEGYYIVGFLAKAFLNKNPGAKIIYDPRLTWNTIELVEEAGGVPVMCKSGHAFIKDCMRKEDAVYGGEMSAHNYFKDFSFCDSGMITWLLVAELLCQAEGKMSEMLKERMERYPISGEINSTVADAKAVMAAIEEKYGSTGEVCKMDGFSVDYPEWRFNVRISNTEPVVRLNVETRGDKKLLEEKTAEVLAVIRG